MSTSDSPAIELAERGNNAAAAPNSAELPSVYEDDVVVMVDEDGNEREGYGIILETSWDSDQSSSDEDEEDEEEEDEEDEDDKLPPGYVRVAWPDRVEEELHVDCLRVIDRSFLHGDVVVSRSNPQGQIGTVTDVRVLADVQFEATNGAADAVVLPRVSSKQFEHPQPYIIGRYVTKGANLGIIQNCFVDIDVAFGANAFDPKAVCTLKKPAPSVYQPRLANQEEVHEDEVGNGVYYPGLRVKAKHAAWKKAVWKVGKHESATAAGDEGTVIAVRPVEISVEWISGEDDLVNEDEEESLLKPSEVTLLGLFEDSRWQVGDHVLLDAPTTQAERATLVAAHPQSSLPTEEQKEGVAADSSSSSSSSKSAKGKKSKEPVVRNYNNAFKFAGTIIRTYTAIKVQWQDGSNSGPEFIPSLHFIARNHLLENDFLPHDYAVVSPSCRLVHVLQVDSQERMVKVRYLTKRLRQFEEGEWWEHEEDEDDENEDDEEEEAPAPAPAPAPASASMRRRGAPPLPSRVDMPQASAPPAEPEGQPAAANSNPLIFVPPQRPPETFDENDHKEEGHEEWVSVFELRTNPQFEFCLGGAVIRVPGSLDVANEALAPDSKLGHAGQVLSMQNGQVTVMWGDLTQTTLEPDQLMIVEHEDEDEDEDEDDEDEDEECEDCGEDCDGNCGCECHEDEAPEDNGQPVDDGEDENDAKSNAPVNNNAFPSEWSSNDYWKKNGVPANAGPNPSAPPAASSASSSAVDATATALGNMSLASSAVALAAAHVPTLPHFDASSARAGFTYSSFDVIEAPESSSAVPASNPSASSSSSSHPLGLLQHKYESTPFAPLNPKAFSKRVRQEWKLLKDNLPPGIHVVGYEQRMDLFKVLVVGNSETPFFCNIFQFDLHLPGDYPASPPVMHFYSRGNRMNPNLYLDGNICLSLLNTWKGSHSTQRWDEGNSNLLQLFVSLQGLVIGVAEPYYLEAGYERQMGQKLACINSHLYNETALVVSLGHLNSYLSQPLQAHPFVNVVVEHALSTLVRNEIKQLETIVVEWEKKKRAAVALKFQQQQQSAAGSSSTAVGETNSTEGQVEGVEGESPLDESRLVSILAKFGIRKSAELHQPAAPAPGGAAPVSPAATPAAVVYNPSLGFVTMLARATKLLSKTLDKSYDTNQKNGSSSNSSS